MAGSLLSRLNRARSGRAAAVLAAGAFGALALATALAHALLPAGTPLAIEILAIAAALTLVSAPLLWKVVIQPLYRGVAEDGVVARTVLDAVVDGVVTIDEGGTIRSFNRAATRLLGYDAAEVIGRNVSLLVPPPHRDRHDAYLARYLDSGVAHVLGKVVEVDAVRKDGTLIPVALSVSEVRTADGREFIGIVRDIAARKRAEDELRQANTLLERLFSSTHAMFAFLDRDFNFVKVNRAYAQADDRAPEDYAGKNHFALYPNPENEAIFRRVVTTGQPYSALAKPFTYARHPERGTTYWDWYLDPVRGPDDTIDGVLLSVVNVTERVRLQQVESLLQQIDQQTLGGEPIPEVLGFICAQTARTFDLLFAWIGRKEEDGRITVMAALESAREYAEELRRSEPSWNPDSPSGRGPTGIAIRTGKTTTYGFDDRDDAPHHVKARQLGVRSGISIPLVVRGEIYGVFSLYSRYSGVFENTTLAQNLHVIADRIRVALEIAQDQQQLRLLGAALASAGNAIFITDKTGRIEWVNVAFTRMCGYEERELRGQNPRFLASGKQDTDYYRRLWTTILAGNIWSGEVINRRKDGTLYTVLQTITPIRDARDEITHFVSINEDITLQKEAAEQVRRMAYYDPLTHLPNRVLFFDRLSQVMIMAKRNRDRVAVLFIDLDRFKVVNDTHGHHVGDALLQAAAERIRACVRESDTVARIAGDEFTVILPQSVQRDGAATVAEKIVRALAEPFVLLGHSLRIGASVGIALYPDDADDAETLIKYADAAMYAAKQSSRNTWRFHEAARIP